VLSDQEIRTIDQISKVLSESNPSVRIESIREVLQDSALQTHNKGENAQDVLNYLLQQIRADSNGPVATKIMERAANKNTIGPLNISPSSSFSQQNQREINSVVNKQSLDELFSKAIELNDAGEYAQSIPYLDQVLALDPNNVDALYIKGESLYMIEDYSGSPPYYREAVPYFDQVLKINPEHVEALYMKGNTLLWSFQEAEAIPYYDKVLTINPEHIEALINKGHALLNLGNETESLEYFNRVLSIDPGNEEALLNIEMLTG
jgi:tetratricopeptide (TPR) repeat protein